MDTRFKEFTPIELEHSNNPYIQVMKKTNWVVIPELEADKQELALLRDALSGLTFNKFSFLNPNLKFDSSSGKYISIDPEDPDYLNQTLSQENYDGSYSNVHMAEFKIFLKKRLFPNLNLDEFEKELKRLCEGYLQPIQGDVKKVLYPIYAKFGATAYLKGNLQPDLTYTLSIFTVTTTLSDITLVRVFNHGNAESNIPGTMISEHSMELNENNFYFRHFIPTNSFLCATLFSETITINENVESSIETGEWRAPILNDLCGNYKSYLRNSIINEIKQSDPVYADHLNNAVHIYDHEIDAGQTGFDRLLKSSDLEEKTKHLSKSARLGIKKYQVMDHIQEEMNKKELGIDKEHVFLTGVSKNMTLLNTNRDSYFKTFRKVVADILTLGFFHEQIFTTEAGRFLDNAFTLFVKPHKAQKTSASVVSAVSPAKP